MDSDRKYRQNGYQDNHSNGHGSNGHHHNGNGNGDGRPRPSGPRPPIDVTGPRLPRLVQSVAASRCFNCAATLPPGTDFTGACPKCNAQLHCCKQCVHFESSTRFQCLKPIPIRIPVKDQANECTLFSPRVTVAREVSGQNGARQQTIPGVNAPAPRNAMDARDAFDRLFRK